MPLKGGSPEETVPVKSSRARGGVRSRAPREAGLWPGLRRAMPSQAEDQPAELSRAHEHGSQQHTFYRWQLEALASWLRCGRRGCRRAVTGSGKTDVAIAPQRTRCAGVGSCSWWCRLGADGQWHGRLHRRPPEARIGRLETRQGPPGSCDVLVAIGIGGRRTTVPDCWCRRASSRRVPRPGWSNAASAMAPVRQRLGLTATPRT